MQANKQRCREVYIVDGARTPFLKAAGRPGPFTAADLGFLACRELLARQPFNPEDLDEVITGCVLPSADEANISRIISLRLGCGKKVPAWSVQRNCASGLQSIDNAMKDIAIGRHDLVLAGGTDAMSHAPLLFGKPMVEWLSSWYGAKSLQGRLALIPKFRLGFLAPVVALLKGLTDPLVGLSMGQTAEKVAYHFDISRQDMDRFAVQSHERSVAAFENGALDEIVDIFDSKGNYYDRDTGVRPDSNMDKLAKLKPFFDKKFGQVTAGNSSQVTDGAAFLILASADAVKKYNLPVLGRIKDVEWAGLDPTEMGLGPIHSMTPILQRNNLGLQDIDYFEINEAFAAQVLGCIKAWESEEYCQTHFNRGAFGSLDLDKLNVDGGAIACGHPIGASGARVLLHLLKTLKAKQAKLGIASLCIGGGQGGAMLVENVSEVEQ